MSIKFPSQGKQGRNIRLLKVDAPKELKDVRPIKVMPVYIRSFGEDYRDLHKRK